MDAEEKNSGRCAQNYPRWQHSCKGAEPHQMAALQCDLISFKGAEPHHMLLFTFSRTMLLAFFSLLNVLVVPDSFAMDSTIVPFCGEH